MLRFPSRLLLVGVIAFVLERAEHRLFFPIDGEQVRFDAGEIVTTGPMFGRKMTLPSGEPAEREAGLLAELDLTTDTLYWSDEKDRMRALSREALAIARRIPLSKAQVLQSKALSHMR